MSTPEEDFLRSMQDPEYKRLYDIENKMVDKICNRTIHSKLKRFWRFYYRLMPARWTGL